MKVVRSMVLVSSDPLSLERGANDVFSALQSAIKSFGLEEEISLAMLGDVGRHDALPLVIIYPEATIYGPVTPEKAHYLVEEHLYKGRVAVDLQASVRELTGRIAWLTARKGTLPAEQRIVLSRAGLIDPTNIEEFILQDGYLALGRALTTMTPHQVIDVIKKSGLRGRGGGIPDWHKMGLCWPRKFKKEICHLQCR